MQRCVDHRVNGRKPVREAIGFIQWLFTNTLTGQWLVGTIMVMGIPWPPMLLGGISALYFLGALWGVMYLISGRGTTQSD
jgi:hypothetical protein